MIKLLVYILGGIIVFVRVYIFANGTEFSQSRKNLTRKEDENRKHLRRSFYFLIFLYFLILVFAISGLLD